MKKFCIYLPVILIGVILSFLALDCKSNSTEPVPVTELAPPTNIKIVVDATDIGGGSFASINWDQSSDEGLSDFSGYVILTDSVDANGNSMGRYDSGFVSKNDAQLYNVLSLVRGERYKSMVYSTTGSKNSQSAESIIYSGVYLGEGLIDEFSTSSSTKSAYGWDQSTGLGIQYDYTSANSGVIDLEMRSAAGQLTFYSPDAVPSSPISNPRTTKFSLVGTGEGDFNKPLSSYSDLTEPSSLSIGVTKDNVYLLKTQDSIYVKLWIRIVSGATYQTATFRYKLQPVQNLKVLKR